ncbi:hypothetical protein CPSG_02678 [Coccidioides posadasii str. Silveira]|uniref:Uncharacterized protein n=2 Tax=Coccidioides posadasii TaxID=199306 RepID=E9CY08_COCPS|nr:hypothetical protein CPSG_02678 [Coccidioides posadasii str. Silveira]KMM72610.1 hypothetical protein CPAG_08903 [Coccidioides posadasii RMSCC 3488]
MELVEGNGVLYWQDPETHWKCRRGESGVKERFNILRRVGDEARLSLSHQQPPSSPTSSDSKHRVLFNGAKSQSGLVQRTWLVGLDRITLFPVRTSAGPNIGIDPIACIALAGSLGRHEIKRLRRRPE